MHILRKTVQFLPASVWLDDGKKKEFFGSGHTYRERSFTKKAWEGVKPFFKKNLNNFFTGQLLPFFKQKTDPKKLEILSRNLCSG
jgi:hypothetical protein